MVYIKQMNIRCGKQKQMGLYAKESLNLALNNSQVGNQCEKKLQILVEEKELQLCHANSQQISTNYSSLNFRKKHRNPITWTLEEDRRLFQKYISDGSKWIEIAESFPTKNDNDCKNRFYCCIRKVLRWVNEFQKEAKHRKMISLDSLLTVLEIGKFNSNLFDERFAEVKKNINEILDARALIIQLATKGEEKLQGPQIETLVSKITQLKYSLKFINMKRVKKSACRKGLEKNKQKRMTDSQLSSIEFASEKESGKKQIEDWNSRNNEIQNQSYYKAGKTLRSRKLQSDNQQKRKADEVSELGLQVMTGTTSSSSFWDVELKDSTFQDECFSIGCTCYFCLEFQKFDHNKLLYQN